MEQALLQAVVMTCFQLLYSLSTHECAQEIMQCARNKLKSLIA